MVLVSAAQQFHSSIYSRGAALAHTFTSVGKWLIGSLFFNRRVGYLASSALSSSTKTEFSEPHLMASRRRGLLLCSEMMKSDRQETSQENFGVVRVLLIAPTKHIDLPTPVKPHNDRLHPEDKLSESPDRQETSQENFGAVRGLLAAPTKHIDLPTPVNPRNDRLRPEDKLSESPDLWGVHLNRQTLEAFIKQGVTNFCGANFAGEDLSGMTLKGDFSKSNFDGANLANTYFLHSNLKNSSFKQADMNRTRLRNANLIGADFKDVRNAHLARWTGISSFDAFSLNSAAIAGVKNLSVRFHEGQDAAGFCKIDNLPKNLFRSNFVGSKLRDTDFKDQRLTSTDFSGSTLLGADFTKASAKSAKFAETKITDTSFKAAILDQADFSSGEVANGDFQEAHLHAAKMAKTKITNTNFAKAWLWSANLSDGEIVEGDFKGAHFVGAVLENTKFLSCDLRGANFRDGDSHAFLDNTDFTGSLIDRAALESLIRAGAEKIHGVILSESIDGMDLGGVDLEYTMAAPGSFDDAHRN